MLSNFFKVALRNLFKRKGYTLINILGLSIGMAVCLLIVLFINSELGYDDFQENGPRIYRMVVDRKYPGRSTSYSFIPQSYAMAVDRECAEVEQAIRVFNFLGGGSFQLGYDDKKFEEKNVLFADSNFFKVFTAKIIAGSADPLARPRSMVMTESTAKKYFGSAENAIGKMLQPEGQNAEPLQVNAVCNDWPANAHFTFDMLLSTAGQFNQVNYVNFAAHTYLLLNPHSKPATVEAKFPTVIAKYAAGHIEEQFGVSFKQFQSAGNGYHYYLQPLQKIHLISHLEGELKPNGSMQAIYIFSIVAGIILLLACINFVNLATARSTERAREVGIRKTFGSERRSLIFQFLAESTLLSLFSMILSIGVVYLLLPLFNRVSGKELSLLDIFSWTNMGILLLFTFLTGVIAGIYPAFVLSSFKPILVLKGKFRSSGYGLALRNGLVVFQFAISVILIICTIIVNSQMRYMTSDKLGFNKEHTIIIERTDLLGEQTRAFKDKLLSIAGVEQVSGASALPGTNNYFGVSWQEQGSKEPMTGRGIITDDQYQSALGLQLKEGRFFSKSFPTDSLSVVLNERAVMELGLKKPIGARLVTPEGFYNGNDGSQYIYTVVGVVKDFHYQSLHQPITPLVFTSASRFNDVSFLTAVRVKAENFAATVLSIETAWKTFVKDRTFQYDFLDKQVAEQYHAEASTQKIFSFFSSLAIFIACIGLLGLAAYATQQRMHEISIRKILGATPGRIIGMLSKDFVKLVAIAAIIAFPVAWYAMHVWLQDFAYRISITWWVFIVAGCLALVVALFTISFQAVRAALANPTKTLRSE